MVSQTLVKEICPTTTQEWVKNGALLVDVREKDEVDQLSYDVPNIINIPLTEFEDRYSQIPKDIDVVMVCRSGGRSLSATGFMINHGYENVVNMQHGINRWIQKGFLVKGGTSLDSVGGSCCSTSECC